MRRLRRRLHWLFQRSRLRARRSIVVAAALGSALLFAPRPARAWHGEGHRIVAQIAAERLSAPARVRVETLLAELPAYASMAEASVWADDIKAGEQKQTYAFAFSSHFVNVDQALSARELHELCLAKAGCVATAIAYYTEVLRSEWIEPADQAEALRFLIHFVGDVHQPLHAGRFADLGGNKIKGLTLPVGDSPEPEESSLHAAWDGGLIRIVMHREGWSWQDYARQLDADIDAEAVERWGRRSVFDWIEESRRFAAANAYLHADGVTPIRTGDSLGEDWLEHNRSVIELRLQQGGVRLALVLEELFGGTRAEQSGA